jgi:pyruvate formate lyase activating enzyme
MDIRGKIFNTQHYSIRDGHGIRTVVFLKGCPASCVWCCNPESQGYDFDLYHVERFCAGCGRCEQVCPNSAISVVDGKAEIDKVQKMFFMC